MKADGVQYVGFWPRVAAALIDTVIVVMVTSPVVSWIYRADQHAIPGIDLGELQRAAETGDVARLQLYLDSLLADFSLARGPLDILVSWVLPAAAIIVFWLAREATPGKMVIGARVVDARTGGALTALQGIVRYLGYYVSTFPFLLGLVWVAFDPRKQGFHDKLAGTVVIKAKGGSGR